jgi:hypothetical protein
MMCCCRRQFSQIWLLKNENKIFKHIPIFLLSTKTKHTNLNFQKLAKKKTQKKKKKKSIKFFSPRQNFDTLKTFDPSCILQEYAKKTQNILYLFDFVL